MRLIHFHRKNELCEKYRLTALLALGLGLGHVSVALGGRVEIKDQGGSNEISSLKEGVCPLFFMACGKLMHYILTNFVSG